MSTEHFDPSPTVGSLTLSLPNKVATLHWNGHDSVHHKEEPHALSGYATPSSFQVNAEFASALRAYPYLTADEIGLVSPETLPKIVWAQEATLLTFALDSTLLVDLGHEGIPRVTGKLVWTLCQDQPAS